jgi:O-acetyl-ADP-ribose deacetylase (regulator of RNase III)
MGTPFYMSPEQAEDPRGVDTRADLYSFGATFYHALTGVPPFQGETAFAVLFKHKTEPLTAPSARNPALSARTSELLERCLAKSPGDRFASFAEVIEQLRPRHGTPSAWDAGDDAGLAPYLERYLARRDGYLRSFRHGTKEVDTYEFPQGRKLRVLGGNLVEQDVDAVVSDDTSWLTLAYGVSQAIREAAGPNFVAEVRRYARVLPGRVAVTSGGSLRARYVFHAATIGYDAQQRVVYPSRDLISEILTSCFYHADSLCVETMAFPPLARLGADFPRTVCLDTMFRFLVRTLLRGVTSVREASIVIYQ